MHLTVAVCTRDRAALLGRCLHSLTGLAIPGNLSWEVVVVDNGSRDETPATFQVFRTRLPIRMITEPRPGLSAARNRAVREARGDYLLWLDDDAEAEADWLAAYHQAFLSWPDAAVFGGPILPRFEGTPPAWLKEVLPSIAGAYSLRDLGSDPIPLAAPGALPFGANFAVRGSEQRRHTYREDLGRMPSRLGLGHEETQFMATILESGRSGRWVPGARVHHWIPRARQRIGYVRRYMAAEGTFRALEHGETGPDRPTLLWGAALAAEARFWVRRLIREPERWIVDLKLAGLAWGRVRARRVARGREESHRRRR